MVGSKEVFYVYKVSSDPSRIYFFDLLIIKYHKERVGEREKFLAHIVKFVTHFNLF